MNPKQMRRTIAGAALLLIVSVVAAIVSYPHVRNFMLYPESRRHLADWVDSFGIWGPVVVLGIQIIQVVIAFLPGEPVEVVAGMVCGPIGGLAVCLLGVLLGSTIVLFLVRRFGKPFVNLFFTDDELYKYRFLRDEKRLEQIVFLIFFSPGTPKDILTYVAGLTKIKPARFLLISTLARVPSIITSTIAGDALSEGNFIMMSGVFVLAGILAVIGLRIHSKWAELMNRESDAVADPDPVETKHPEEYAPDASADGQATGKTGE